MLDLDKLEQKLDEALNKETCESLIKWVIANKTESEEVCEDVAEIHRQYAKDPRRKDLLRTRGLIILNTIPKYIVNYDTQEFKVVYDEVTQKLLEQIDKQLLALDKKYFERITKFRHEK